MSSSIEGSVGIRPNSPVQRNPEDRAEQRSSRVEPQVTTGITTEHVAPAGGGRSFSEKAAAEEVVTGVPSSETADD